MPCRQSTVVPSTKKPKAKKITQKRSLNALAIAEQRYPQRTKHRQGRLGELEQDFAKRKRRFKQDDSEEEDDPRKSKKPRAGEKDKFGNEIEGGSDSEGNEWVLGQVDADDDSDLDSDEAMGESDEQKFEGFTLRGSSAMKSERKPRKRSTEVMAEVDGLDDIDLHGDVVGHDLTADESEAFGDDAVDLATMLDASSDDGAAPKYSDQRRNDPSRSRNEDQGTDGESSIDEEDSALSYSEDEGDSAHAAKLASLQNLVSAMNDQDQNLRSHHKPIHNAQESTAPSEFGLNSRQKLTVADLLPSITDPHLKKSLKLLAENDTKGSSKRNGIPKKLGVPLAKRQQDRLDRSAAYEKSKETLNRWIDSVKYNRRAEHLSFPLQDLEAVAAQGSQRLLPTAYSRPLTDLESTIQNILQDSGLGPTNNRSEEEQLQAFEELESKKMPLEEVQARRAELRQARALLFREEIRAKRIKKIKSKSFRRVHRKERERNAQKEKDAFAAAGVDDSESEQERNDRRRAEERMGARHRDSKWARSVKDSGRAKWDDDARSGVTEMARRGEELRRRIDGKVVRNEEDESISSGTDSDDEEDKESLDADQRKARKLRNNLQQIDNNGNESAQEPGSSLSSMKFMKNAEALRKGRNDADAENLRREIAGDETPSEEEQTDGPGRRLYGTSKNQHPRTKVLKSEQRSVFEEQDSEDENEIAFEPSEEEMEVLVDAATTRGKNVLSKSLSISRENSKKSPLQAREMPLENAENPWLFGSKKKSNTIRREAHDSQAATIISNALPAGDTRSFTGKPKPRSALKGRRGKEQAREGMQIVDPRVRTQDADSEEEQEENSRLPFVMRNQELVRKAFAGDEVVADFEKEKRETVRDEQEKIIDNTLPGWGSWTGDGVSKKAQKRNRGRFLTKEEGISAENRKDAKLERVIINEKRIKKNVKYLASNLPHPFETRQQYERSLRLPVGPEWTTKETFQSATKPRILMKQGIIAPMEKPIV